MTFEDTIKFHGHACPGLALGYRVANLALKELGLRARDEELVAIVENNSCAVDAIQFICGCTFGKGNLIFKDFGKQVFPQSIDEHKVQLHLFDGYWEDIGTIKSFYEANLSLAKQDAPFELNIPHAPTYSRARFLPPCA